MTIEGRKEERQKWCIERRKDLLKERMKEGKKEGCIDGKRKQQTNDVLK